jgi:hypothetical protein
VLGEHVLFLVFWIATGIIALFGGVVVIVNAARQMERAAAQSSRAPTPERAAAQSGRATKPEDALAA